MLVKKFGTSESPFVEERSACISNEDSRIATLAAAKGQQVECKHACEHRNVETLRFQRNLLRKVP